MTKILCIYHGACDDGFAAAWCVRHAYGDEQIEFYPGVYQQKPPDVTGRRVLFVDFSYKRPVLEAMVGDAQSILIIDHHATARDDLFDLQIDAHLRPCDGIKPYLPDKGMHAYFDMTRSGAGLAWDYFHPGAQRPRLIDYVEDRDLWKKALPGGDEFTIALRSYPQDFGIWDELIRRGPDSLIEEGHSIQRYYRLRVEELKRSAYLTTIAGHPCAVANAPYFAASEVAGELAGLNGASFGACYFEVEKSRWQYSLRSRSDFDVSEIARKYGGGGHKNASGFTVDAPIHFLDRLPKMEEAKYGGPRLG